MQTYTDGTGQGPYTITLTDHESREWARCAQDMYSRGQNDKGHILSVRAAIGVLPIRSYDEATSIYRAWLVFDDITS